MLLQLHLRYMHLVYNVLLNIFFANVTPILSSFKPIIKYVGTKLAHTTNGSIVRQLWVTQHKKRQCFFQRHLSNLGKNTFDDKELQQKVKCERKITTFLSTFYYWKVFLLKLFFSICHCLFVRLAENINWPCVLYCFANEKLFGNFFLHFT